MNCIPTLVVSLLLPANPEPPLSGARAADPVQLRLLSTCSTGPANASACEIAAWHPTSSQLLVTSASAGLVPVAVDSAIRLSPAPIIPLKAVSSVAVHDDTVAVCHGASDSSATGEVALLDRTLKVIASVRVGFGPDMLTFTPDGRTLLVANEAEPTEDGAADHPGTVSIIDLSKAGAPPTVREVTFESFEPQADALRSRGLHIPMPGRSMCQQLEPEYIAVSPDGKWAFVVMQEANAVAFVDIAAARCIGIEPLGLKDFGAAGVGLDPSDKDSGPAIARWPVHGLYQPDTIVCFTHGDELFVATANEGEPREHSFWSEARRVSELKHREGGGKPALDPQAFPAAEPGSADPVSALRTPSRLCAADGAGRLQVSSAAGDTDGDGDYDRLVAFGGRSASIWLVTLDAKGVPSGVELVWDSGSAIERTVLERMPGAFNADHDRANSADARSDVRGPEPEGLAVADIDGRRILLVGLERCGGVIAWDISDPRAPTLATYANRRNPTIEAGPGAGDLGPEGVLVIPASKSPSGKPLIVLCNEVSGTLTVLEASRPHAQ